jgi:hypothetical protein
MAPPVQIGLPGPVTPLPMVKVRASRGGLRYHDNAVTFGRWLPNKEK